MKSDFIGKTIILVNKPYEVWEYGYSFYNLDNLISDSQLNEMIDGYFYDDSSSKKGYSGYSFARNTLESIDDTVIKKWADFAEMYPNRLEEYLTGLVNPFNNDGLDDLFHKIPLKTSPIISLSKDSLANIYYGEKDGAEPFYFPDEGMGLFTEIQKIELFDIRSLRRFANVFGLPLGIDLSMNSGLKAFDDMKDYNTFLYFGAVPVTLIYMELMEYKNIFNSFVAVKTNDAKLARSINLKKEFVNEAGNVSRLDKERSRSIQSLNNEYESLLNETDIKEEIELMQCRKNLAKTLTKKIAYNSKIVDTLDGDFLETKIYNNLFEIAYSQMKESLINNVELKKCDYCGHYFEPEHGTQRFCSPLPFRKRSSCENSYNQAKYKKRKQKEE